MSSIINHHNDITVLWFKKFLSHKDEESPNEEKLSYLSEKFIEQLTNKDLSNVFLHKENVQLSIDTIYDLVKKEEEIIALLEYPDDLESFTIEEIACHECVEKDAKIEEQQKILEMQRSIVNSNKTLIEGYENYLEKHVPELVKKIVEEFDGTVLLENNNKPEIMGSDDQNYNEIFVKADQNLIFTIQNVITELNLNHTRKINELQDKIMEHQLNAEKNERLAEEINLKLQKYKHNCQHLLKQNKKLSQMRNQCTNCEESLENINKQIENGNLLVTLKSKNDKFIQELEKKTSFNNEKIVSFLLVSDFLCSLGYPKN
uniref:CSON001868 protein n=1 Tax=Culicoides sonorensis TaxID=179676 RepID=A0A336KZA5_CULSO